MKYSYILYYHQNKQQIMENGKKFQVSLWTTVGRILFNSLILALVLYRPKLNFDFLMGSQRKYSMKVRYIEILKPIPPAVVFSLLLIVPTNEGGRILRTKVFAFLCMPWMYSCCIMFIKNFLKYMQCLYMSVDMDINAYRICYITIIHVTIFFMAVELMMHWITLHHCRRSAKTRIMGYPFRLMLCFPGMASRQRKK